MRYCVDGTEFPDEDSEMLGDGGFPPFMIFDTTAQEYTPEKFKTRGAAQLVCDSYNRIGKETPSLSFYVTMHGFEVRKDGRAIGQLDAAGFAPAFVNVRFTRDELLQLAAKCLEVFQVR